MSGKVSALGHTAGINQRVPSLGWDEVGRSLRHRPKPTPLPLPQFATAIGIVEHDDPDEGVRERARAEIREKAGRKGAEMISKRDPRATAPESISLAAI